MFVVGYPLDYETLLYIFNVKDEELNTCVTSYNLETFYSDKGQYILGLMVPDTEHPFHDFIGVDNMIINILQTKKKFLDAFAKIGTTSFQFYPMESELVPSTVEPCVFSL